MDQNIQTLMNIKLEKTRNALIKNNMETHIVENKEELNEIMTHLIKEGSSVNVGGSQTLFEAGIIDLLRDMPIQFNDRYTPNLTVEELENLHRQSFMADYFITSSNAITEDGLLYNVDGKGNRVAALTFGPKHVIVIAGINKIVPNLDAAIERVKNTVAPANAIRLNKETPCTNFGHCADCKSKDRICSHFLVTGRQATSGRITIILVKESLGY